MPNNLDTFHTANLAFILDYTDGTKKDEIESELYRIAFQEPATTHYDRENGVGFQEIEQETANPVIMLLFIKNMIESVYRLNEEREFNPYIVVGYNDIENVFEQIDNKVRAYIKIYYRLLQDLQDTVGDVKVGI